MLEPQSTALFLVLMLVFAALIWWMVTARQVVFRILAACLAFVPAMLFGVAAVNKYYDYYQSWGAVVADLSNQSTNQSPVLPSTDGSTRQKFSRTLQGLVSSAQAQQQGYTVTLTIYGKLSHLRRTVLVYLPPQYFQPGYAHYQFPAIELFPGYPGQPSDWINIMGATTALQALVSDHLARPAVLVMPDTEGAQHRDLECLNLPHSFQDATYLARDVPEFVSRTIRVQPPGPGWGAAGYSEGGYCAANLGLRYRQDYGYAGVMSGYFSPLDILTGPNYTPPFPDNRKLRVANWPQRQVARVPVQQRIPQFWLGAGGADTQDVTVAREFQQLLLPRQPSLQVNLWRGGGHNGATWRGLLTPMLEWMTRNLADAVASEHGHAVQLPPGSPPCPTCLEGHGATASPGLNQIGP